MSRRYSRRGPSRTPREPTKITVHGAPLAPAASRAGISRVDERRYRRDEVGDESTSRVVCSSVSQLSAAHALLRPRSGEDGRLGWANRGWRDGGIRKPGPNVRRHRRGPGWSGNPGGGDDWHAGRHVRTSARSGGDGGLWFRCQRVEWAETELGGENGDGARDTPGAGRGHDSPDKLE